MADASESTLRQRLLKILAAPKYQPLDKTELAHKLQVSADDRGELRHLLKELEIDGTITRIRKNRFVLPKEADLFTGVLQMNPRGFGFVTSDQPGTPSLYIAAEHTGVAMNGDQVVARLQRDRRPGAERRAPDGAEGVIIRILKRAHTTLVGTLQKTKNFYHVLPDDPRLVKDIYLVQSQPGDLRAQPGEKVVVELDEWTSRHVNPEGRLIEVLGQASAPGVDMLSIIRKHHLPGAFPDEVLAEADAFSPELSEQDRSGREDLRGAKIFTIDPDDARDFDDAVNVERRGDGWLLGVHIADVSHYVLPGGALDREAWQRGNSVYLPDRVIPMLPERLSNGLCSLRPDEDRLTFTAWMEFDRRGSMRSARFTRSVIRSMKRLSYQEAFAVLQGQAHSPVEEELRTAWELAALLRKRRFAHGSLDLDFPEIKVRVDHDGRAIALEKVEHDRSHQLIEEFMLAANEAVAKATKDRSIPAVYRIHEKPDPEKLAEYREMLAIAGIKTADLTKKEEVQKLLLSLRGRPDEPVLKVAFLRSLKRATYDVLPKGHYGLAKSNYTHFTSPIRRYADLVVHRVLAGLTGQGGGRLAPAAQDLKVTAEHISLTERVAADAEREAVKLKKLEYFSRQLEMKNPDRLDGLITEVKNYGLVVDLPAFALGGLVHISDLPDFYLFDPVRRTLTGKRNRHIYQSGQPIKLIVSRVDAAKQQIDFRPA